MQTKILNLKDLSEHLFWDVDINKLRLEKNETAK